MSRIVKIAKIAPSASIVYQFLVFFMQVLFTHIFVLLGVLVSFA